MPTIKDHPKYSIDGIKKNKYALGAQTITSLMVYWDVILNESSLGDKEKLGLKQHFKRLRTQLKIRQRTKDLRGKRRGNW